jgi:hypothetical protein
MVRRVGLRARGREEAEQYLHAVEVRELLGRLDRVGVRLAAHLRHERTGRQHSGQMMVARAGGWRVRVGGRAEETRRQHSRRTVACTCTTAHATTCMHMHAHAHANVHVHMPHAHTALAAVRGTLRSRQVQTVGTAADAGVIAARCTLVARRRTLAARRRTLVARRRTLGRDAGARRWWCGGADLLTNGEALDKELLGALLLALSTREVRHIEEGLPGAVALPRVVPAHTYRWGVARRRRLP